MLDVLSNVVAQMTSPTESSAEALVLIERTQRSAYAFALVLKRRPAAIAGRPAPASLHHHAHHQVPRRLDMSCPPRQKGGNGGENWHGRLTTIQL